MARTNNLGEYLTDIANAIREKTHTEEPIKASEFDEIIKTMSGDGAAFYTVETIEERDALEPNDGDVCLVQKDTSAPVTDGTYEIDKLIFPRVVTTRAEISASFDTYIRDDYWDVDISINLQGAYKRCNITIYGSYYDRIYYTTTDGITFISDRGEDVIVPINKTVTVTSNGGGLANVFAITGEINTIGIHKYTGGNWSNIMLGLPENGDNMFAGTKALTDNGVVTGTFGSGETTAAQIIKLAEIAEPMCDNVPAYYRLFEGYTGERIPIDMASLKINSDSTNHNSAKWMFMNCTNLKEVDLSRLDTTGITDFSSMFSNCNKLEKVILPDIPEDATDFSGMLAGMCEDAVDTEIVFPEVHLTGEVNMASIFSRFRGKSIDMSKVTVDKFKPKASGTSGCWDMFYETRNLLFADIRGLPITGDLLERGEVGYAINKDAIIVVKDDTARNALKTYAGSNFNPKAYYTAEEWDTMNN